MDAGHQLGRNPTCERRARARRREGDRGSPGRRQRRGHRPDPELPVVEDETVVTAPPAQAETVVAPPAQARPWWRRRRRPRRWWRRRRRPRPWWRRRPRSPHPRRRPSRLRPRHRGHRRPEVVAAGYGGTPSWRSSLCSSWRASRCCREPSSPNELVSCGNRSFPPAPCGHQHA